MHLHGACAPQSEEPVERGLRVGGDEAVGLFLPFHGHDARQASEGLAGQGRAGRKFDARIRAGVDQQPLGGVQGDDSRVVHDGHAVAEDLGFVHVMRGEDDRFALALDQPHQIPEVAPGLGIEAGRRLVEKEDLRVVHQGDGDGEPLFLSAGELLGPALRLFRQLDFRQLLPGVDFAVIAGGKDVDQLDEREVLEER